MPAGAPQQHGRSPRRTSRSAQLAGKSTFGPQCYSQRESFPVYSFTKGTNSQLYRTYDKELAKHSLGDTCSPGPAAYQLPPSITGNSGKRADFTTLAARGPHHLSHAHLSEATPAPGFHGRAAHTTSFGTQVGVLRTHPCYSFGSSGGRNPPESMYLSRDLAKTGPSLGTFSPGPQSVGPERFSSLGRQLNSKKSTSANATFGRATRFESVKKRVDRSNATPGPGSYDY
mmetsp:Transcript_32939/g.93346  ORF Transcript_32939/g.93346 Transcript_32939/m.93346 type:complete len:229 (-) Transcript_32939:142-828(-)